VFKKFVIYIPETERLDHPIFLREGGYVQEVCHPLLLKKGGYIQEVGHSVSCVVSMSTSTFRPCPYSCPGHIPLRPCSNPGPCRPCPCAFNS
jgi:hypothetical protein